jgi:ferredoxin
MAYKITEDCAACGSCELECPNQAIYQGDSIYQIKPERCTECVGAFNQSKCAEICPLNAPQPDPDHKETREQLLARWQELHPGKKPQNV